MSRLLHAPIPARAKKCGVSAQRPRERISQAGTGRPVTWELHIGVSRLYISGTADDAWLACSEPDYSPGPSGTPAELRLARAAVAILNRDHRHPGAGVPLIRAALAAAASLL